MEVSATFLAWLRRHNETISDTADRRMHNRLRRPKMNYLDQIKLTALMNLTAGSSEIPIGLIDGPIATDHSDLAAENIHEISGKSGMACTRSDSIACTHGTFIAGILCAKRNSAAPAICPDCPLLLYPIFAETKSANGEMPSATPDELAAAVVETVNAGARVLNLSVGLANPSSKGERRLEQAFDYAAKRGVITVAAAGNQGTLGSTAITRHSCVIPVVACDLRGRPMNESNMGSSIGRRGLSAPGEAITSLATVGNSLTLGGTSVATPFVTGAIALLWSAFPMATAGQVKFAVTQAFAPRRTMVVPPLLNAWAAYQFIVTSQVRR